MMIRSRWSWWVWNQWCSCSAHENLDACSGNNAGSAALCQQAAGIPRMTQMADCVLAGGLAERCCTALYTRSHAIIPHKGRPTAKLTAATAPEAQHTQPIHPTCFSSPPCR